jgi:hypothetical protein
MDAPAGEASGAPGEDAGRPEPTPDFVELLRELGQGSQATWQASRDAAKALRLLFAADVSLARSAFGRTLAFTGLAIAFGASAWLLLMAALIAWLSLRLGWSWALSLLLTAVVSLALAAVGGWQAMRHFEHTRLQATRRQLARLGVGELSKLMPSAGSGTPAKHAAERVEAVADETTVKPDLGVEITPP